MKRLALCVGLNYPGTSAALSGCINDADDWGKALGERGYEVRTLREPTKMELAAELRAMVARARYRDRIVFTYSGHGTWVPDKDGDEADGRDEALVCKDYNSGGLLLDDELNTIFGEAVSGVRRLILSDSCHSGSVSRFAGVALKNESAQARFLPPVMFLDGAQLETARRVEKSTLRSAPRKGTVLISGCADPEYSYDATFNGRPNGAMTYYALQALPAAGTVAQWYAAIRKSLPSHEYPQTPQLTAERHQRRWSPL